MRLNNSTWLVRLAVYQLSVKAFCTPWYSKVGLVPSFLIRPKNISDYCLKCSLVFVNACFHTFSSFQQIILEQLYTVAGVVH